MERSLRNRLTLGPILLLGLFGVLALDHGIERWTSHYPSGGLRGVGVTLLLLLLLPLAVRELATLFAAKRVKPFRLITSLGCALLVLHAFFTQFAFFQRISTSLFVFIVTGAMIVAALQRALAKQSQDAIVHMAGTVLATLYLGGLAWFLIALRVKHGEMVAFHGSTWHVVMILLVVKGTDIGAYFTGRAIGKRKLIPWLSPGKTWEGLAGGLVFAGLIGAGCARSSAT
ncbi:MAG: phosphatidate cytidylyltransferase [Tepidisphaeraceae bacterium]